MIAIQQGEIHLWIACDEEIVDESLLLRYRQLLSAEEAQQLPRFHHIRHQHQYLVSRALLRHVLSLYLGMPAVELQFRRNSFGKPFLLRPAPASLSFNLSHTDGRIALAIANEGDIGVDIESSSQSPMALEIARSHFARVEFEQLLQTPRSQQPDRFLDFWTLKEAYIKACGEGLSIPLDHFAYVFQSDRSVRIAFASERDDQPERWQFWQVVADSGHRIAIAHKSRHPRPGFALVTRKAVPLRDHQTTSPDAIHSAPSYLGSAIA